MNAVSHAGHAPKSSAYRFDHPRLSDIVNDMYVRDDEAGPGDTVAPFRLQSTDGAPLHSAELAADGRPTLLVFGSRTCPVTESAADGLRRLHASYGERVRFVMVQVREAHPGALIPQAQTASQKMRRALDLKRHHRFPFEVAVDDIDGAARVTLRAAGDQLTGAEGRFRVDGVRPGTYLVRIVHRDYRTLQALRIPSQTPSRRLCSTRTSRARSPRPTAPGRPSRRSNRHRFEG